MIRINMTDTNFNADEIEFKTEIGRGSYGEVWQATWRGQDVAAKKLHPELLNEEHGQKTIDHYIGEFRKEWEVLRKLNHPNIVKMQTVLFPPNESPIIIMELMHSDLFHYIEEFARSPQVSPSTWLSIALGIAQGLEYLHGLTPDPVVHRDLATKNILLTADGQPKIGDLGVAKIFAAGKDVAATAGPGTPVYAAPETYLDTVNDKAKYGVKVDIFSFGVILLAMVVGHEPVVFPKKTKIDGTRISEIERREEDIKTIRGHRLEKIILDCLHDESSRRPDAPEIAKKLQQIKQNTVETKVGQLAKCTSNADFMEVSKQKRYDHAFKIIFLGNSGVGKSCMVQLLKDPNFQFKDQVATIGIHFKYFSYKYNSKYLRLNITDTAGQEIYHSLPPNYIRNSDGVVLVYDISDIKSFEMLRYWLEMVEWYAPENCKILIVGNKVDLREPASDKPLHSSNRSLVAQDSALIFASNFGIPYLETSATDIDSIYNMLQYMVEMLIPEGSARVENIHLENVQNEENKKCPCCSIS